MICDRHLIKLKPTDVLLKKRDWIKKKSLQYLSDKVPKTPNSLNSTCEESIDLTDDEWYTEEDEDTDHNMARPKLSFNKVRSRKKNGGSKLNRFSSGAVVAVEVITALGAVMKLLWVVLCVIFLRYYAPIRK